MKKQSLWLLLNYGTFGYKVGDKIFGNINKWEKKDVVKTCTVHIIVRETGLKIDQ